MVLRVSKDPWPQQRAPGGAGVTAAHASLDLWSQHGSWDMGSSKTAPAIAVPLALPRVPSSSPAAVACVHCPVELALQKGIHCQVTARGTQGCHHPAQPGQPRAVLRIRRWIENRGQSRWDQTFTAPMSPSDKETVPWPRVRGAAETGRRESREQGSQRRYRPHRTQPGWRKRRFPSLLFPRQRKQPERRDPGPLPAPARAPGTLVPGTAPACSGRPAEPARRGPPAPFPTDLGSASGQVRPCCGIRHGSRTVPAPRRRRRKGSTGTRCPSSPGCTPAPDGRSGKARVLRRLQLHRTPHPSILLRALRDIPHRPSRTPPAPRQNPLDGGGDATRAAVEGAGTGQSRSQLQLRCPARCLFPVPGPVPASPGLPGRGARRTPLPLRPRRPPPGRPRRSPAATT